MKDLNKLKLNEGELFFIEITRKFDFLRKMSYIGSEFNINGPEFWIIYYNYLNKSKISVINTGYLPPQVYFSYMTNSFFKIRKELLINDLLKKTSKEITIDDIKKFIYESYQDLITDKF